MSKIELSELPTGRLPEAVGYAVLTPPNYELGGPYPLCLVLMGGGGSRDSLVACQPLFDSWWSDGLIPPMVLATPSAGMSYYLDHPDGSASWESLVAQDFLAHLRATYRVGIERLSTAITGISMGGYGALKIAFAHPDQFGVVAAVQPMLEPGLRDAHVGPRNRLHHLSGGPPELVGPSRDPGVFEANNPANRARDNAVAIRDSGLAIYLEVGDEDFVNAHDGTEFLHRVLWDLDISHEYHLVRGADHGGPTFIPRMRAAYSWVGSAITALRPVVRPEPTPEERAVNAWIEGGMSGDPPPVPPTSKEFLRILRAQLRPLREETASSDPNTNRRFGVL